jgi:hypothetical protein
MLDDSVNSTPETATTPLEYRWEWCGTCGTVFATSSLKYACLNTEDIKVCVSEGNNELLAVNNVHVITLD